MIPFKKANKFILWCDINISEVVVVVLIFHHSLTGSPSPPTPTALLDIGCWIHSVEKNCTIHTTGLAEQTVFWNTPFGLVALLALVLFIAALYLLCYANKHRNNPKVMITDSILSLAFLAIRFVLFVLEATTHSYSFNHGFVDVWLVYAVSTPIGWAYSL